MKRESETKMDIENKKESPAETKMDVENDDIIEYIYIYYLLILLLNLSWNEELA